MTWLWALFSFSEYVARGGCCYWGIDLISFFLLDFYNSSAMKLLSGSTGDWKDYYSHFTHFRTGGFMRRLVSVVWTPDGAVPFALVRQFEVVSIGQLVERLAFVLLLWHGPGHIWRERSSR